MPLDEQRIEEMKSKIIPATTEEDKKIPEVGITGIQQEGSS